jgi:branched-chain amino acid transport system substrate-binding protein
MVSRLNLRALAAVFFAVCFVPAGTVAAEPFEINVIIPLTGPGAFTGRELQTSLSGVEAYANRTGGVRGRPVKFVYSDDQTSPQVDVQLVNGFIAKGVPVVLGPSAAGPCAAVLPLVKNGPTIYCFSPAIHPPAGSFVFSSSVNTNDLLRAAARYFRGRSWTRIAIISANDASGQDGERSLDDALALPENRGLTLVAREHFNTSDVSVAAQMAHIKASGAQAVLTWAFGTGVATLLRGANDAGLDLPILTSASNTTEAQMKLYEGFLPRQFYCVSLGSVAFDQVTDREQRRAIDVYFREMNAMGDRATMIKTFAWDPALFVVRAYRALGLNATAEQFRSYFAGLKGVSGITGVYDYNAIPQRGLGVQNAYMVRWDPAKATWVGVSRPGGDPLASRS